MTHSNIYLCFINALCIMISGHDSDAENLEPMIAGGSGIGPSHIRFFSHWSDLDECDALEDDSDSEGSVAVDEEDVAYMRDYDCSSDGSE